MEVFFSKGYYVRFLDSKGEIATKTASKGVPIKEAQEQEFFQQLSNNQQAQIKGNRFVRAPSDEATIQEREVDNKYQMTMSRFLKDEYGHTRPFHDLNEYNEYKHRRIVRRNQAYHYV